MSSYSFKEVRKAMRTALAANGTISAAVSTRIYSNPQRSEPITFPYLYIAAQDVREWDSKTRNGERSIIGVHVFTNDGLPTTNEGLIDAVIDVLHTASLTVTGQTFTMCRRDSVVPPRLVDGANDKVGVIYQGIVFFEVYTHA